jgi:hypothetical protein
VKALYITTAVLAISLVAAFLGVRVVSAATAENGCTAEADLRGATSISGYSWSWSPLGTTCTFDHEYSETRLFW